MAGLKQLYKERDKLIKAEANLAIKKHYMSQPMLDDHTYVNPKMLPAVNVHEKLDSDFDVAYHTGDRHNMGVNIINEELDKKGINKENYPDIYNFLNKNRLSKHPIDNMRIADYLQVQIDGESSGEIHDQTIRGTNLYEDIYEKKLKVTYPQLNNEYGFYDSVRAKTVGGDYGKRHTYEEDFGPIIGGTPMLDPVNVIARRGRNGDSELREVDGQMAHVTKGEASLIDILGESVMGAIKNRGAGTINPNTGLKEYHGNHTAPDYETDPPHFHQYGGEVATVIDESGNPTGELYDFGLNLGYTHEEFQEATGMDFGNMGTEDLGGLTELQQLAFLENKVEGITGQEHDWSDLQDYFGDIYKAEPYQFARDKADLSYRDLETQKKGFQMQQASQVRGIMSQADKMKAQSGFARSGSIDYARDMSMKDISKSTQLGMEGFSTQKANIGLSLEKSLYDIGESQDKEFWNRLALGEEAGWI